MIANLHVQHQRRIEDDLEPWDEYVVTAELRTFHLSITHLQDGGFGIHVAETIGGRGVSGREQLRASSTAPSWHAAYAAALEAIAAGITTGVWPSASVPPPISLLHTPQWQRRRHQRLKQHEEPQP